MLGKLGNDRPMYRDNTSAIIKFKYIRQVCKISPTSLLYNRPTQH